MLTGLRADIEYLSFLSRRKIGSEMIEELFIVVNPATGEDAEYRIIDRENLFVSGFGAPIDGYIYTMTFTPIDNLVKVIK
jgi:hypothetical protein